MSISQIQENLRILNKQKPAKPAKKPAAVKTNGVTHLSPDESLRLHIGRVIAAFGLDQQGVTVDSMVAGVEKFEAPYQGAVQ